MCIIHPFGKFLELHKTRKNRTVYKVLCQTYHGLTSPYHHKFRWEIGKTYIQDLHTFNGLRTSEGLYCYKSLKRAKEFADLKNIGTFFEKYVIATCIIPKNSYYYEDKIQMCTNQLKITKIL